MDSNKYNHNYVKKDYKSCKSPNDISLGEASVARLELAKNKILQNDAMLSEFISSIKHEHDQKEKSKLEKLTTSHDLKVKYKINPISIGKGSFATVYLATDSFNKKIAIKKIGLHKLENKRLDNFLLELEISQKLNHNNIVKCFEVFKTKTYWYMVCEYCNSGSLKEIIPLLKNLSSKQRESIVFMYMSQLKNALQYLRNQNIIHRDLKPANILLHTEESNGTSVTSLKLADFGFARYFTKDEETKEDLTMTLCGSPLYMAPEMLIDCKYSMKADLWSFGIVLYELIYGENPYVFPKLNMDLLKLLIQKVDVKYPHTVQEKESSLTSFKLNKNHESNESNDILCSKHCINLMKKLIRLKISDRIGWNDFFSHEWFDLDVISYYEQKKYLESENNIISDISNIANTYNATNATNVTNTPDATNVTNVTNAPDVSKSLTNVQCDDIEKTSELINTDNTTEITITTISDEINFTSNIPNVSNTSNEKSNVLNEKSNVLNEKSNALNEKSNALNEKSNVSNEKRREHVSFTNSEFSDISSSDSFDFQKGEQLCDDDDDDNDGDDVEKDDALEKDDNNKINSKLNKSPQHLHKQFVSKPIPIPTSIKSKNKTGIIISSLDSATYEDQDDQDDFIVVNVPSNDFIRSESFDSHRTNSQKRKTGQYGSYDSITDSIIKIVTSPLNYFMKSL